MNTQIGHLPRGPRNTITDVASVLVGHAHLHEGKIHTGVTAIIPSTENIFLNKLTAASHVINGFGKSIGLVQIDELGTLETPIILTNTLSVGTCSTALIKHMLKENADIGETTGTVNPVVCECNDSRINDIRGLHVTEQMVFDAIANASDTFNQGGVGAGSGMCCYGLKGGIGSSSRQITLDAETYTIGILVMSNFGSLERLLVDGEKVGAKINGLKNQLDSGSVIIILATDAPVSDRQLKRLLKRVPAGLARTGSYYGNGSGDIAVGFTTANKMPHYSDKQVLTQRVIYEDAIEQLFVATVEATEEAVLNSLMVAEPVTSFRGTTYQSLGDYKNLV